MAITRKKKEELVAQYKEQIENASAIVFTDYKGTDVPQIQSLRSNLSEADTVYTVIKNSLFAIALKETSDVEADEMLEGPNAVAFLGEDIGKGVKALKEWMKGKETVQIKGAVLDQDVLDAKRTDSLSELPTKEQTLAMVLGAISAPAGSLVRMLNAPSASLARVINAHVEAQREEGG